MSSPLVYLNIMRNSAVFNAEKERQTRPNSQNQARQNQTPFMETWNKRFTMTQYYLLFPFLLINTYSLSSFYSTSSDQYPIDSTTSECFGLECFSEWRAEEGYWVGEYSFYQSDGTPFESERWNYPYHSYKGFITGAVRW